MQSLQLCSELALSLSKGQALGEIEEEHKDNKNLAPKFIVKMPCGIAGFTKSKSENIFVLEQPGTHWKNPGTFPSVTT